MKSQTNIPWENTKKDNLALQQKAETKRHNLNAREGVDRSSGNAGNQNTKGTKGSSKKSK